MRALVLALLLASIAAPAYAASKQELIKKEKRLEDVRKQIREERKEVRAISEKETNVLGELETINKSLNEKRGELNKIEGAMASIQARIGSANRNISRLEGELKSLSGRLKARLKAMYKMKRGESMQVLFSSESSRDLGRRHKYLTLIMDNDTNLIIGYEKKLSELSAQRASLASLQTELYASKKEVEVKSTEAEGLKKNRLTLLRDIKGEKEKKENMIRELEDAANAMAALIEKLRASEEKEKRAEPEVGSTGFAAMKGRLRMPVEGTVVSLYGKVKHPKYQTVTFNNGIMIEAPVGSPVESVGSGKVIYEGWLKGYGEVLILDHGGGFYTLYAHLSKVLKGRGASVSTGDEIALVGDTGPTASGGLYFEIRQKGVPRDPMAWLIDR
ncbi:MAG: peptidoglycan DD-metalloendopeptidase family protein [Deltaproteobacteria bacterium]|nr:peptidoglycan DD-metalloendopeptidase family protein [Deltaproteobacteria bacterium]